MLKTTVNNWDQKYIKLIKLFLKWHQAFYFITVVSNLHINQHVSLWYTDRLPGICFPFPAYLLDIVVSYWLDVSLTSSSVTGLIVTLRVHSLSWRLHGLLHLGSSCHDRRRSHCSCWSADGLIGYATDKILQTRVSERSANKQLFLVISIACSIPEVSQRKCAVIPIFKTWNKYSLVRQPVI